MVLKDDWAPKLGALAAAWGHGPYHALIWPFRAFPERKRLSAIAPRSAAVASAHRPIGQVSTDRHTKTLAPPSAMHPANGSEAALPRHSNTDAIGVARSPVLNEAPPATTDAHRPEGRRAFYAPDIRCRSQGRGHGSPDFGRPVVDG